MALVKCEECGKEISDKTKKCIHCGVKILSDKQKLKLEIKKENKKARKKILKTIFIIFLILGIVPFIYMGIAYLFPIKNINFQEKYYDYLVYAFGNDVEISKTDTTKYFTNFWFNEEDCWAIKYRDNAGVVNEIDICNYDLIDFKDKEKASDYVFAGELLYRYSELLENKLEKSNISNLDKHINIIISDETDYHRYYKGLPDIVKVGGLSFKEISLNNIPSELYYLSMDVYYKSGDNIEEYTKNEALKVINNYNIKNAFISAGFNSTSPVYCQRNGYEVACPYYNDLDTMNNNMLDSNNYIYLD